MSELAATAQSLREVRAAYQDFLMQWALEEMAANTVLMAHMAGEILRQNDPVMEESRMRRSSSQIHCRTILDD